MFAVKAGVVYDPALKAVFIVLVVLLEASAFADLPLALLRCRCSAGKAGRRSYALFPQASGNPHDDRLKIDTCRCALITG